MGWFICFYLSHYYIIRYIIIFIENTVLQTIVALVNHVSAKLEKLSKLWIPWKDFVFIIISKTSLIPQTAPLIKLMIIQFHLANSGANSCNYTLTSKTCVSADCTITSRCICGSVQLVVTCPAHSVDDIGVLELGKLLRDDCSLT